MKVLIAGAGAVGTLVGGKLAVSGSDVLVLSRHAEYADAVAQKGLRFRENDREVRCNARVYSDLPKLFLKEENVNLAILAVKSFSTRSILLSLTPYLHRIQTLVTLGNGLGNEETLFDYVNPNKIIAGALTIACSMVEPGLAVAETRGGIALAPMTSNASISSFLQLFKKAGFSVKGCSDWRSMKWSKLLLNIMGNATCAILDMTMLDVVENPRTFRIERELLLEALAVMRAHQLKVIALPGHPIPLYMWGVRHLPEGVLKRVFRRKVASGRGSKLASLHLDFRRGKRETEWPFMYGALLEKAREKGIRTPVIETLCKVLEGITSGKIPWDNYRRNPKVLSDAILETIRGAGA